jgi:GT2 family glycosyltransferase
MRVLIDGRDIGSVKCNLAHRHVTGAGRPSQPVGFHAAIPAGLTADTDHVVEFRRPDGAPVVLRDPSGIHSSWIVRRAARVAEAEPIQQAAERPSVILGALDPVRDYCAWGWAYDRLAPHVPVTLDVFIDGALLAAVACDLERPDVLASGHPSSAVGFRADLPTAYFDGRDHILEIRPQHNDPRRLETSQGEGGERQTFNLPSHEIVGCLDGLRDGAVRGWVFRRDNTTGATSGGLQVLVTMHGHPVAQIAAREYRGDVAAALGCGADCGFSFYPPLRFVAGRTVEFDFRVIPSLETVAAIRDLEDATDKIFAEIWKLRSRLRQMAPAESYTVENYDGWARDYRKSLAAAPDRLAGLLPTEGSAPPLVSIICPAYKPRLSDFEAAVDSVRAQTYPHWELIVVDDASGSAELTARIAAFVRQDRRIKATTLAKNGGISAATNAALARAKGTYIALFDHDDLLADRAIEFMLAAALRTGAQMLYSDEDKIDDAGVFSEPNFKPDWNYRLLLSQNYVCHLLFVERTLLAAVGPFNRACDGAQDHDIIIRLSETVPHDRIVHVPEVLYHWRKTPTSTAGSGGSKPYTVAAGIRAIQDHLDRKGLKGRAHSPRGFTCFGIDWALSHEPSVTVLIPYREHIAMTRACVEALQAHTDYANYRILLIDNWSTSDEALAFAAEMDARAGVSVLRVAEPFNYSRLNNLGVAASEGELLLFLNNDVFVSDPGWLRTMVGEMLADPRVGIVGAKLLYPGGLVQHGGVILGVGGVGDHAHRGRTADDPGYGVRAISAQEMSAVTAACMLCRRDAFASVGGFDEQDLQVAFNDIDLCLKIGRAGYRIVWTPAAVAEHRESLSRGDDMRPDQQTRFFAENEIMLARWGSVIAADPPYHRAFSRHSGIFAELGAATTGEFGGGRPCVTVSHGAVPWPPPGMSTAHVAGQMNGSHKPLRERRAKRARVEMAGHELEKAGQQISKPP